MKDRLDTSFFSNSSFQPEAQFEKTVPFVRDAHEFLRGVYIKEIDPSSDTIPGELIDIMIP